MTQEYPLFIHWSKTLDWIMDRCEGMPKHTRFTFSSRLISISLEVLEKIIEAIYQKERGSILRYINLLLEKIRVFFRICFQRTYISGRQYRYISEEVDTAGKMVGGWLRDNQTKFR